jgi:glucuronoarabinoxylan endo-1,4-beta-xylanase
MQESFTRNGVANQKRLSYSMYATYAQYLNAYVTYMKNNGVNLYAISVQNEPDYASTWTWWTPAEMLNFVKNNAGSITCKVIAPESFQFIKNMSDPFMNDPVGLANVDIIGGHLYGTPLSNFAYPLFQEKGTGKSLWMTEHYFDTDGITDIMNMSKEIHDCMVTGQMNAYVYWWITYGNGLATSSGTIYKRAYVLGQFAKFIRPGYYRVDATANPTSNVYVSAYKGDNTLVIVAINTGNSSVSQKFTIQNGTVSTVSSYATDNSRNLVAGSAINVTSNSFTAQLPAQSITTFVGASATVTDIEMIEEPVAIETYPNPFQVEGIQIKNGGKFSYQITALDGVLMEEGKGNTSKQIGLNLLPGIYFLRLENEHGVKVQKIIRQ